MVSEKETRLILAIRDALRAKFGDRVISGDLRWGRVDQGSPVTLVYLRPKADDKGWLSEFVEIKPAEHSIISKEPIAFQVHYKIRHHNKTTRYPINFEGKLNLAKLVERVGIALVELEREEKREEKLHAASNAASVLEAAMLTELKSRNDEDLRSKCDLSRVGEESESGAGLYSGKISFDSLTLKEIGELLARVRGFQSRGVRP